MRAVAPDSSAIVTFERSTYIESRFATVGAISPGRRIRNRSHCGGSHQMTKFASIRPFGELKHAYRTLAGARPATSTES
jgi:hypothetical protein